MKNLTIIATLFVFICGGVTAEKLKSPTLEELSSQVVLYTVHEGNLKTVGKKIGKLYAVAGRNSIPPMGPLSFTYLNDQQTTASTNWLTEIRIPVGDSAFSRAGNLGKKIKIKTLPAHTVALITKELGESDRYALQKQLERWVKENGYTDAGPLTEVFISNAQGGNYSIMKTELMIPVEPKAAE